MRYRVRADRERVEKTLSAASESELSGLWLTT